MPFPNKNFICFDGADGLGKSTQIELISKYLLEKGKDVTVTREPGSTKSGSMIRDILLNTPEKLPLEAEALLFMADRSIHINQVILPSLEQNKIVLCDRYYLSTLVYQCALKGLDSTFIGYIQEVISNGLKPWLTFVFYGQSLKSGASDEFEKNLGDKSHEMLNKYYYEYGKKRTNHILINANRPKEEIFEEIILYLDEYTSI